MLQRRVSSSIADLRKGAVVAKLRVGGSFLKERKEELLGLPQAAGVQMIKRERALVCGIERQNAIS